jgi:hypothetical protein
MLFACPTHKAIEPAVVIGQRCAIGHAAKHDVEMVGDVSLDDVKQSTIDTARNRVVARALNTDADGIFWCDSDIILPVDTISRMAAEHKDFITGIYYQRYHPHFPVVGSYDPTFKGVNWYVTWPENVIAPADLCGFGCVWTSLTMLRAMEAPYFAFQDMSEDFTFCRQAKLKGFQLYVDTGIQCDHIGQPKVVTADDFKAAWATLNIGKAAVSDGSAA